MAGIILGGLSVLFALENLSAVTVTFFNWQMTTSLATLILGTVLFTLCTVVIALVPALIRNDRRFKALWRENKELQNELSKYRITIPIAPPGIKLESFAQKEKVLVL
jgi:uncharacterized integral membrane protein